MTESGKRTWFRLRNLPVALVALAAAAALFWMNVPGEAVEEVWDYGTSPSGGGKVLAWVTYEHGWPLTHLHRGTTVASPWSLTQGVTVEFTLTAALVDVGTALLIVAVFTGAAFAWMRRTNPWQFGLSSLLAAFVLAALVLGWWRSAVNAAADEQPLIDKIEEMGGVVTKGFVGPVWLRKLLGRQSLPATHRVIRLDLSPDELVTDPLKQITPEQLRAAVRQIPTLACCQELVVSVPLATDDDLAGIRTMSNLRALSLPGTKITDQGLRQLEPLAHLTVLGLSDTQITDAAMPSIALHQDLDTLDLRNTRITDRGLQSVTNLPRLSTLSLVQTGVSDEGLSQLLVLKRLATLIVSHTRVTAEGVRRFKAAMPRVYVDYDEPPEVNEADTPR